MTMNNDKLMMKENFKNKLMDWGASIVGFGNVQGIMQGNFKTYKTAVSIGIKLLDSVIDEIGDSPTHTYFKLYRTVNALLDEIALKGGMFLEKEGYKAYAVPASQTVNDLPGKYTGVFQHKTAAYLARLGFIGKSALFISDDYGPRIRLATILTDMDLTDTSEFAGAEQTYLSNQKHLYTKETHPCENCRKCVDACPAEAISGELPIYESGVHKQGFIDRDQLFDAKRCSDYMNKQFRHIGRGSVCGICIKVCPYGRKQK